MKTKEIAAGIYWIISLFAMMGEPSDEKSIKFIAAYYAAVLANLAIATFILKRISEKEKHGDKTATN